MSNSLQWLNIALMTANSSYRIELMHSVASRICVFMFAYVPFEWTPFINVKTVFQT